MSNLGQWSRRVWYLLNRRRVERELDREMAAHRALMSEPQRFGSPLRIREANADVWGWTWFDDLMRDLRYGVRGLRRAPGFTVVAVVTLALGVGATTAIYSVVDAVLVQPLPFQDADRLVRLVEHAPPVAPGRPLLRRGITHQEFLDWRARARTLSDAAAIVPMGQRLARTGQGAAGLWGARISENMFALFGVRPYLGRTMIPGDERNPDVVVLSFDAWQRHFNADPAVVGTALELRAGALQPPIPPRLLTVIGVLPAEFELPTGPLDYYLPLTIDPSRPSPRVVMIGRLAPGVSLQAAADEAALIGSAMRSSWPADAPVLTVARFELTSLKDQMVQPVQPALRVLLAAVVVVLAIVCANVANLLLARGIARRREIALRLAIGGTRSRIVRLVMVECLVLAIAGGALGALVGAIGVTMVKQLAAVEAPGIFRLMFGSTILPRADEVGIDPKMFGVAFSVALVTSVVFGLLPALRLSELSRVRFWEESRVRGTLVVGQLVMATMLLVGAGLLTHSFVRLASVDSGYDPTNVLAVNLLFPDQYSTARKADMIDRLLASLRSSPNVLSAGFSRHGLLLGEEITVGTFVPRGRTLDEMRDERTRVRPVSDGYLTAMGVPVLEGREFESSDTATASPAIVMNRAAARQYFGTASPLGQAIDWYLDGESQSVEVRVVGVVEDLRQESPTDEVFPEVFVDYRQFLFMLSRWSELTPRQNEWAIGFLSFALRTAGEPASAIASVRQRVSAVDHNIGIDVIVPMERLVASAVARERFYAVMLSMFAGVAAVLAAIGLYGVLTYVVTQRTQEIGTRMALGAPRGQVLTLVLRKGVTLAMVGITLGLVGAVGIARVLQGMLFGITPLDPTTFITVSLVFLLVSVVACYVPARRATRVDPIVALRAD